MDSLGVVAHPTSSAAARVLVELTRLAGASGMAVTPVEPGRAGSFEAIVALGGDGTMLRAAREAGLRRLPLLGVNLGRIGFLSAAEEGQLEQAVAALRADDYGIEPRMLLDGVATRGGEPLLSSLALNEVVVEKATPSRVIDVDLAVGDEDVARYTADGFIVATPTGSTAYALSAGGPILEPDLDAMVLVPVCAHSLRWRAIVVGTRRPVVVTMVDGGGALVADGQPVGLLPDGSAVSIQPHPEPLRLIRLKDEGFFSRFRSRFDPGPSPGTRRDR